MLSTYKSTNWHAKLAINLLFSKYTMRMHSQCISWLHRTSGSDRSKHLLWWEGCTGHLVVFSNRGNAAGYSNHVVVIGGMQLVAPVTGSIWRDAPAYTGHLVLLARNAAQFSCHNVPDLWQRRRPKIIPRTDRLFDLFEYSANLPGTLDRRWNIAFVAVPSEASNCQNTLQVSRKPWLA